jgi:basic membrane lipoprotein Med (substrate-binding protein (PBP1-ABC) superfamily)
MLATQGKAAALSLYRGIFRAHRRMPMEMRMLGDTYVRSEFKLHKPVKNGAQLDAFFKAWEQYLDQMLRTSRRKDTIETGAFDEKDGIHEIGFGKDLPNDVKLSDAQKDQLEKLREETTRGGRQES